VSAVNGLKTRELGVENHRLSFFLFFLEPIGVPFSHYLIETAQIERNFWVHERKR
jgi:hypothetical protein